MDTELVFDGDASKYEPGDPMLNLTQSQRAYVEEVAYYAQQEYNRRVAAGEPWVLPEVCVAQAVVETGWGSARGGNDFGIKSWSGSDRQKVNLRTAEQNTDGSYVNITAGFEQTSGIQDSVELYYEFLEKNSRYSKALNLDDPYQSIAEIHKAGYATSLSYTDTCSNVMKDYHFERYNQSYTYDYNKEGYEKGCEEQAQLQELFSRLTNEINECHNNFKRACDGQPIVDYPTFSDFPNMLKIMETLDDLLTKTKNVADNEKMIGEAYGASDGDISSFQAASMALQAKNYAFENPSDFADLLKAYQESKSDSVFSSWFSDYISENGIESKVVDMDEYTKAIKETGAVASEEFVVSKVKERLEEAARKAAEEEKKQQEEAEQKETGEDNNREEENTSSDNQKTEAIEKVESVQLLYGPPPDPDTKEPSPEEDKISEEVENVQLLYGPPPDPDTKEPLPTDSEADKPTDPSVEPQETVPDEKTPPTEEIVVEPTPPGPSEVHENTVQPQPAPSSTGSSGTTPPAVENNLGVDPTPTEEVPKTEEVDPGDDVITVDETGDTEVTRIPVIETPTTTGSSKKSGSGLVAIGLGLGATAAAGAGGAYYLHKKHESFDEDDYDSDVEEDVGEEIESEEEEADFSTNESYQAKSNLHLEDGSGNEYQYEIEDDSDSSNEMTLDEY